MSRLLPCLRAALRPARLPAASRAATRWMSTETRRKILESEFDRVDLNKDGVISREEFMEAYGSGGVKSLVGHVIDETNWPTCNPKTSAKELAKVMNELKTGWVVVTGASQNDILGIITERDVVRRALDNKSGDMTALVASDIMTKKEDLITVSTSDSVWDLTKIFLERGIRAAPVLDDGGQLVGFVSIRDAVAQLVEDHSAEIVSLNGYINGSY